MVSDSNNYPEALRVSFISTRRLSEDDLLDTRVYKGSRLWVEVIFDSKSNGRFFRARGAIADALSDYEGSVSVSMMQADQGATRVARMSVDDSINDLSPEERRMRLSHSFELV